MIDRNHILIATSAFLAGVACDVAIESGGKLFGLGAVILTIPAVGFIWVCANKAIERLHSGIEVKLSK